MSPEEENLTESAKLLQLMKEATKDIGTAVDKAKANGVVTRKEALEDRKSVNLTTLIAAAGMIFAGLPAAGILVWWLINQMIDPIKKTQDAQGDVQVEIQKDIRELYRVSSTGKSDRLERPVHVAPTKEAP